MHFIERDHAREQIVHEIITLSKIARVNGSRVSLSDVLALTSTDLSEEQLRISLESVPEFVSSYTLADGLILPLNEEPVQNGQAIIESEHEKNVRASKFIRHGAEFGALCKSEETMLFAISGSTSYKTALASDDLDIFCITRPDSLWLFLTKSLLIARFQRIFKKDFPRICFSYAVDRNFGEHEFSSSQDALYARDALTALVIYGREYYKELLRKSTWISDYFPRLYETRISATGQDVPDDRPEETSPGKKFLNSFLRVLVGNYIALKSAILNMRLKKQHRFSSLFNAKIAQDHCIFESVRYARLRTLYLDLNREANSTHASQHPSKQRS